MDEFDIFAEFPGKDEAPVVEPTEPKPEAITVPLDEEEHTLFPTQGDLYDTGNRVLNARLELMAALQSMADLQVEQAGYVDELNVIREQIKAIDAKIDDVKTRIWDQRQIVRRLQMEVQQAENALRSLLDALKTKQEFLDNAAKFDELTLHLKWREWALEHQIEGAKFIATAGRAICGDKMGLGKSLTSLITADMLQVQRLLIIVPDDVTANFAREIAGWAPHRTTVVLGKKSPAERHAILTVLDSLTEFTVVLNYSAWRRDRRLLNGLKGLRFQMVIIDEAHTIKTTSTSSFVGCRDIVLAENSCPECRGRIQRVHNPNIGAYKDIHPGYIPHEYYACNGEERVSNNDVHIDKFDATNGCGWSHLRDILQNVDRDYGYMRSVRYVLPMTGTPILNSPTDLYPLLHLVDDKTFHNKNEFVREYCERNPWNNRITFRPGGLDSLINKIGGRYIARDRKTAGVVLPKQTLRVHDIAFDREKYSEQYKIIKQLTKHAAIMLESGNTMPILAIIALITRKRQANVWPAGITFKDDEGNVVFEVGDEVRESIKVDKIIERPATTESGEWEGMIPDFTGMGDMVNGERVVVFSQFKGPLAELETRCREAGISVVRFDGDTPEHLRDQVKVDFDRKYLAEHPDYTPQWQVILANYKTGGVGLNFTDATQMILLDEEWNPGKEDQALMRIDRIGQTQENCAHILRLSGTIDEWLAGIIDEKRDMIEGFNETVDTNDLLAFLSKEDEL